ncbi:MAG: hypothetical protein ACFFCO_11340 [Promethearchaeota archaeon]
MHRVERTHQDIVDEYRQKFVETAGKIQRFRDQHKRVVQETAGKMTDQAGEHPDLELVVAAYHLAKIDELIHYTPEEFADDVITLRNTLKAIEPPPPKPKPAPTVGRERVVLKSIHAEPETPAEIKQELKILALLVNSLGAAWSTPIDAHKIIVDEKIADTPDEVVQASIIMNVLQPWISVVTDLHHKDLFDPDLRWLISLITYTFEENLRRKDKEIESRNPSRIYGELTASYPIAFGEEYQWDILFFGLIRPLWSKLVEIAESAITTGKEELEADRRATPQIQKALEEQKELQFSIEFAQAPLEFRLHHVFRRGQEFTEKHEALFESLMDRVLRRTLVEKYGVQDIKDQSELLDIASELIMSLVGRFPELLLPIVDHSERKEYYNDPAAFLKKYKEEVETRIQQQIRRGAGMKITPFSVGRAFAKYIKLAASMQR